MNKKYILSTPYIEYEDACIHLFEEMNKEGWELKKVGLFFVFEKTNKKLKYQVDMTERDTEFNEILKSQGYFYMGSRGVTHFYASENLEAPDITNDPEVKRYNLLKRHSMGVIVLFQLIAFFLLGIAVNELNFLYQSKIDIYLNFYDFLCRILLILFSFLCFYFAILEHNIRQAIQNDSYTYEKYGKRDRIINYILFLYLTSLLLLAIVANIPNGKILVILFISAIHFATPLIRDKFVQNEGEKKKRSMLEFMLLIIVYCLILGTNSLLADITIQPKYPNNFPQEENIYDINKNPFVYRIQFISDETDFDGIYYECRDDEITAGVFDKLTSNVDLEKFDLSIVDECYEIDNEYIFRKDNLIVRFTETDPNHIEKHIQEYIDFYEVNDHFN